MEISAALAGAVCACVGWRGWKLVAGRWRAAGLRWIGQKEHQRQCDDVMRAWDRIA